MSRRWRKLVLTGHLVASLGWIGAAASYLGLAVTAASTSSPSTVRAMWTAMEVVGWFVIVPLAVAALVTGVVVAVGTRWGLLDHYWVVLSLLLTALATGVTVLHMPTVSAVAARADRASDIELRALGGDLLHPGLGLVVLLVVTALNVYKPRGRTPWARDRPAASADPATLDRTPPRSSEASTS